MKIKMKKLNPFICGAKRDRTADLLNAIQALSQLSYSPKIKVEKYTRIYPLSNKLLHKKNYIYYIYIQF